MYEKQLYKCMNTKHYLLLKINNGSGTLRFQLHIQYTILFRIKSGDFVNILNVEMKCAIIFVSPVESAALGKTQ